MAQVREIALAHRAPLAWLVGVLGLGYSVGRQFPESPTGLLLALGLAAAGWAYTRRCSVREWTVAFLLGGTLLAWGYFTLHWDVPPAAEELPPPREVAATLEVERLFRPRAGNLAGLATLREANVPGTPALGRRVSFYLDLPDEIAPEPLAGAVILARGVLEPIDLGAREGFDDYLRDNAVYFRLSRGEVTAVTKPPPRCERWRKAANEELDRILRLGSEEHAELGATFAAMLLGNRAALSEQRRGLYVASGTMHLFAISGLHVMAMAGTLHALLTFLRVAPRPRALAGLAVLLAYVHVVGAPPSAVRAYLMVLFFWGARALLRQSRGVPALMAAGVVVLLLDPREFWGAGFRLSFGIVGAILLYGLPLGRFLQSHLTPYEDLPEASRTRLQRWGRAFWEDFLALVGVSVAASTLSAPLIIGYFETFTPGAVVLNLALMLMASLVVANGMLVMLFGLVGLEAVAEYFNHGAWLLLWMMNGLIDAFLTLPGLFFALKWRAPELGPLMALLLLAVMLLIRSPPLQRQAWTLGLPPLVLAVGLLFATTTP